MASVLGVPYRLVVPRSGVAGDAKERSQKALIADIVREHFGDTPDLNERPMALAFHVIFLGAISCAMAAIFGGLMLVLWLFGAPSEFSGVFGAVGVTIGLMPLGLMLVWSARAAVAQCEKVVWTRRGSLADALPSVLSQPHGLDLVVGAAWLIISSIVSIVLWGEVLLA